MSRHFRASVTIPTTISVRKEGLGYTVRRILSLFAPNDYAFSAFEKVAEATEAKLNAVGLQGNGLDAGVLDNRQKIFPSFRHLEA